MNTKKLLIAGLFLTALYLIQACGPTRPEIRKVNPAFAKYISGYTSGVITRKSTIRIELAESTRDSVSAKGVDLSDPKMLKQLFSFEPQLEGKAVWVNERVIEFIPKDDLPVNQFYDVDFDLGRVTKVPEKFENFHFQFSTYAQTIFVREQGLRTYQDYSYEWQYLEGEIVLSDQEETENLEKAFEAVQAGKKLPVEISFEPNWEHENRYVFRVDSVQLQANVSDVRLQWDGSKIHSTSSGNLRVSVPAQGDYTVSSARLREDGDQVISLYFTQAIAMSQDLDGIIRLDGVPKLTYSIDGNEVKVFLPEHVTGVKWLHVGTGIMNTDGHRMKKEIHEEFTFSEPKPLVRIRGNGSILPNSQGLIFPFEAISLKSVNVRVIRIFEQNVHHFLQVNDLDEDDGLTRYGKVIAEKKIQLNYDKGMDLNQWNNHVLDLGKLIKPQLGAIYRVAIKFGPEDALCNCDQIVGEADSEYESEQASSDEDFPHWNEKNWHGYGFGGGYDTWSYYDDDYSPCNRHYYYGKAVARNILASDLGLVFKLDENKLSHVFVNNMLNTDPVNNAEISYYTYSKELIATGRTNAQGMLEMTLKEKPFLMVARFGDQRGYLKLSDGHANSMSKFDVEGEVVQRGVKGYIYGERGVWRPGDSLYLNFILEDKEHSLPAGHPVHFELRNPAGQQVYELTTSKNVNGMYRFATRTSDAAPTGNYTANVRVGNRLYTKNLKVETVKPNRLKIYLDVEKDLENSKAVKLASKWLHGAPARNLDANVQVSMRQKKTVFKQFKKYLFDSPIRRYRTDNETVFAGSLNEKGETHFNASFNEAKTAPGKLNATFFTRVFEAGGDFSIDRQELEYSPFKRYIGLQAPDSRNFDHSLLTNENHEFSIVSVDEKGQLKAANRLEIKIYRIEWRWWYDRNDEDLISYLSRAGSISVKDTIISTTSGKAQFKFRVNYPDYGRYLMTVTDLEDGHQTGTEFTIDWPFWSRSNRKNSENASMLSFSCDKEAYTKGEQVKLSFPSPASGRALISIENAHKVLRKFWVNTNQGETTTSFEATEDMAPNAYIHVTLIQPHATTANDLPIRMYGVIPLLVDDPDTHLQPILSVAESWRPESTANIKVKEQNGRAMSYTLAVVDEGLLDLTGFRTPQPWQHFYAREALGVKTWDMYDDVIGAYSGKLDKLLSIGGDGENDGGNGAKANRFKPMVRHLGPFELKAGHSASHSIEIPNYVGSVRVMVVAAQDGRYGSADATVAVKKPLMLLTSLPRVLGPGEEIALPVNVFAMENHVHNVSVSVESNDMVTFLGEKSMSTKFNEPGDEVLNFRFKVAERLGIARFKIKAVSGNETAYEEIEVDVRPSNPMMVEGEDFVINSGDSRNYDIVFSGLKGTNSAVVELSRIPSLGLNKRLEYLISYPHGCIEQTTSGAFPQLYVSKLTELSPENQAKADHYIGAALKRLQLFQTSEGGFSYWPGAHEVNQWGTNYAGHFMLEAEKMGYAVSTSMRTSWLGYQQKKARNWDGNDYTTQAYRLFVLALSRNPELGAMNRLREHPKLNAQAKWRLAAAYHLAGQTDIARKLVVTETTEFAAYRELSGTFGSSFRDRAMVLETLSLLKQTEKADELATKLAADMSSDRWMSTQETAYGLLAMCQYAGVGSHTGNISAQLQLGEKEAKKLSGSQAMVRYTISEKELKGKTPLKIKNLGGSKLFAKVMVSGIPLKGDEKASSKDLNMTVEYKDMMGNKLNVAKMLQGTDFIADVTISNPGKKGAYREMALNQIFPGGWEIHNGRLGDEANGNATDYQDVRDDRVLSYYRLEPGASITIKVRLNAAYQGKFYLPAVYTEAMYNNLISAKVPGKWVEVVPTKKATAEN